MRLRFWHALLAGLVVGVILGPRLYVPLDLAIAGGNGAAGGGGSEPGAMDGAGQFLVGY